MPAPDHQDRRTQDDGDPAPSSPPVQAAAPSRDGAPARPRPRSRTPLPEGAPGTTPRTRTPRVTRAAAEPAPETPVSETPAPETPAPPRRTAPRSTTPRATTARATGTAGTTPPATTPRATTPGTTTPRTTTPRTTTARATTPRATTPRATSSPATPSAAPTPPATATRSTSRETTPRRAPRRSAPPAAPAAPRADALYPARLRREAPEVPVPTGTGTGARVRTGTLASRARTAVALLLGYYVLAAAVVALLVVVGLKAVSHSGTVVVFCVGGIIAIARAVFTVEKRDADPEAYGVPVTRADEPALWAMVDDVAASTGFPAPVDLRLVEDVNAFVYQDTRLLGLVGGDRHLCVGTALLQALTVDELRAVLAHELGHYAGGDTRLSALVYRAERVVVRTVANLGEKSVLGRVFSAYADLFRKVSLQVRRGQELQADEAAVRVAGRATHVALMQELQAAAPAWDFFLGTYAEPVWRRGLAPRDLYDGFRRLLDEPARQQEMDRLRAEDSGPSDPLDSHPSGTERIAHALTLPDAAAPGDLRAARHVLVDPARREAEVSAWFHGRLLGPGERGLLDWDAPELASAYARSGEVGAAALSAATAALDGGGVPAGLGRTLALLEADRDVDLVTELTADRRSVSDEGRWQDLVDLVLGAVHDSAAAALVGAGAARWQVRFDRPLLLTDPAGQPLPLYAELGAALDADDWKSALRAALGARGVPLDDVAVPEVELGGERRVAFLPELVGRRRVYGLRPGFRYDGIVTHDRLLAVPQPRWPARLRFARAMARGYKLPTGRFDRRREQDVEQLLRTDLAELAARPDVRQWRWDDLAAVAVPQKDTDVWPIALNEPGKPVQLLYSQGGVRVEEVVPLLERLVGDRLLRS